jgi:riboflavin kinase/FMN adenylyltransferase
MGNFDGVHRGHRSVIDIARAQAAQTGAPLGVVTFEPHPRSFFAPDAPPFRLMNAASRAHRMERLGVDRLFVLEFNAALAGLSAEAFAADVLAGAMGLSHVVVGADFRFGKGRAGDAALLRDLGAAHGFGVSIAELIAGPDGEFSSTAIRAALTEGRPEAAADMLGHWHRIDGVVAHGEKRGRTLGFPTANLALDGLHLPKFGVYAVTVEILTGPHAGRHNGAASIGVRPMFGVNSPNLEVYIFDFAGDIYGEEVSVALVAYLRGEEKFDSLDALVAQMDADCAEAKERLATARD